MSLRLLLIFVLFTTSLSSQVQLNEIMPDNEDFIFDQEGNAVDWLEIYNHSEDTISLSDWYLSDDRDHLRMWAFGDTSIMPKSHIVVWGELEDDDLPFHLNFGLSANGESIYLIHDDSIIHSLSYPALDENEVYGFASDTGVLAVLFKPTPGLPNASAKFLGDRLIRYDYSSPLFSDSHKVRIRVSDSCHHTLLNLDGRDNHGQMFDEKDLEIVLSAGTNHKPYYSLFPTSPHFKPPGTLVKHPHVSAFCFSRDSSLLSRRHQTFIDRSKLNFDLPVAFLDLDEDLLFHPEYGIMVEGNGTNYDQEGRNWEREGQLTLIDRYGDVILEETVGARIHGHATRLLPQKSVKIYFRPEYGGGSLKGELLDQNYELDRFLFRSFHSEFIGNEFTDFGFRDDIVQRIIRSVDNVYTQASRPTILYINGEFWGLYSLHEATDDDFLSNRNFDYLPEEIEIREGPDAVYQLYKLVKDLDLNKASDRAQFETVFDLENVVNYVLVETFFGNTDWPHNNVKLWKPRNEDRPFKFVVFDMDATMKKSASNPFSRFFSDRGLSDRFSEEHNAFYQYLMSSDYFLQRLQARYFEWRNGLLKEENMLRVADKLKDQLSPFIREQTSRWHYPRSYHTWEESFEDIQHFLISRHLHFMRHLTEVSPSSLYPNPNATGLITLKPSLHGAYMNAEVFDIEGRSLGSFEIENGTIDLSRLMGHQGMVLIKLLNDNSSFTEPIILLTK